MKIQIHAVHFDASQHLTNYIQKKVTKLITFSDTIIDVEVFLRIEKPETPHNKIVEMKLNIPQHQCFAKEKAETFEAATDIVTDKIKEQIKRYKQKKIKNTNPEKNT
ncbi:MAG: ribosome-associated translation inhibitor RaiA [Chitinophagaceae bacterium]|nr:ribosome-associated translation inhibitor RaiA [Chitinophagaceae bacterium]